MPTERQERFAKEHARAHFLLTETLINTCRDTRERSRRATYVPRPNLYLSFCNCESRVARIVLASDAQHIERLACPSLCLESTCEAQRERASHVVLRRNTCPARGERDDCLGEAPKLRECGPAIESSHFVAVC